MGLAAAITAFTNGGALGGGIARPSTRVAPQVALVLVSPGEAGMHSVSGQGTARAAAPGAAIPAREAAAPASASASPIRLLTCRAMSGRLRQPPAGSGPGQRKAEAEAGLK